MPRKEANVTPSTPSNRPSPPCLVLTRLLMYGVPLLAIMAAAVVLLGPGRTGPALGVRVWGLPSKGARCTAFRLEGVRRQFGADDRVTLKALTLSLRDPGSSETAVWSGDMNADGIADARLCLRNPLNERAELEIKRNEKQIAHTLLTLRPHEFQVQETPDLTGITQGSLLLRVQLPRGDMLAPFEDVARVFVETDEGQTPPDVKLDASVFGASLRQEHFEMPKDKPLELLVKPTSHLVELTLKATVNGVEQGAWEGILPVLPGAIWLDPASVSGLKKGGRLRLLSPSPRARAYVSLLKKEGRVFGADVPLAEDSGGFFAGVLEADLTSYLQTEAALVVAGDPIEQGPGTHTWPLVPSEGRVLHSPMEMWLDAVPQAEAAERERASSARKAAVYLIAALSLFEVLFFITHTRRERRAFEANWSNASKSAGESGEREPAPRAPRGESFLWALVIVSLLVLAFAWVAALAWLR